MKSLEEVKKTLQSHKEELKKKYGVRKIGIFGSYVRGEAKKGSDIDILVDFEKPIGLQFVELADELERLLDIKVELITKDALMQKARLWKNVSRDLAYV